MEVFGLITAALYYLAISSVLALIALIFRPLRRFALAVLAAPPAAIILFYFTRWWTLDNTPGCEVDVPDFSRCPSPTANIIGWVAWILSISIVSFTAYWIQRVFLAGIYLFINKRPISLFKPSSKETGDIRSPNQ